MLERAKSSELKAIGKAVRHLLGEEAREIARLDPRPDRRLYLVRLRDREVVLKVILETDARAVGCDYCIEALGGAGIPTPATLAVDRRSRPEWGGLLSHPFVILERAAGVAVDKWLRVARPRQAEVEKVLRQVGAFVQTMNSIRTPGGFGALDDEGHGPEASWWDHLAKSAVRHPSGRAVPVLDVDALRDQGLISDRQARATGELFDRARAELRLAEPHLLHNDLTLSHVFLDPESLEVTSILDLHKAVGGDPALELARFFYYYRNTRCIDPFFAGYGQAPSDLDGRWPVHLVYVLLGKLTWLAGRSDAVADRIERDLELLDRVLRDGRGAF